MKQKKRQGGQASEQKPLITNYEMVVKILEFIVCVSKDTTIMKAAQRAIQLMEKKNE